MSKQQDLDQIVEALSNLSVLDMSKLKVSLEEKWGVKAAAAPVMMAAPAAGSAASNAVVESTEFQVTIEEVPNDKKIGVIKVVRELSGVGLKDAKDLVDTLPKVFKETSPKAEAEDIKKKIEAAGGKVTLKGL